MDGILHSTDISIEPLIPVVGMEVDRFVKIGEQMSLYVESEMQGLESIINCLQTIPRIFKMISQRPRVLKRRS